MQWNAVEHVRGAQLNIAIGNLVDPVGKTSRFAPNRIAPRAIRINVGDGHPREPRPKAGALELVVTAGDVGAGTATHGGAR